MIVEAAMTFLLSILDMLGDESGGILTQYTHMLRVQPISFLFGMIVEAGMTFLLSILDMLRVQPILFLSLSTYLLRGHS